MSASQLPQLVRVSAWRPSWRIWVTRCWPPQLAFRAGVPLLGGIAIRCRRTRRTLRWLHAHALTGSISNSYAGRDIRGARIWPAPACPERDRAARASSDAHGRQDRRDHLGGPTFRKDHPTALAAVARLRARVGERLHFTIVGSGPEERRVRAAIRDSGLVGCAELVTDTGKAAAAHARADVYLSASRFEGLSNTVMEAMAHALPIVTTSVGDNARLVGEGVNGHLSAPERARAGGASRAARPLGGLRGLWAHAASSELRCGLSFAKRCLEPVRRCRERPPNRLPGAGTSLAGRRAGSSRICYWS
jgi:hypothetical protein